MHGDSSANQMSPGGAPYRPNREGLTRNRLPLLRSAAAKQIEASDVNEGEIEQEDHGYVLLWTKLKWLGSQFIDLMLELLDFAFEHNSRPHRAGQGKALLLDRKQALQRIEQDVFHGKLDVRCASDVHPVITEENGGWKDWESLFSKENGRSIFAN